MGIISCTWKDTPAEAWASYDALEDLPSYNKETEMLESLEFNPEKIEAEYARKREKWYQALYEHDMGWCVDHQVWAEPDYSDENWKTMELPGYWEDKGMKDFDGVVWFRKTIDIPRNWTRKNITINLGNIADESIVYYNGTEIGRNTKADVSCCYKIPYKLVKRGKADHTCDQLQKQRMNIWPSRRHETKYTRQESYLIGRRMEIPVRSLIKWNPPYTHFTRK